MCERTTPSRRASGIWPGARVRANVCDTSPYRVKYMHNSSSIVNRIDNLACIRCAHSMSTVCRSIINIPRAIKAQRHTHTQTDHSHFTCLHRPSLVRLAESVSVCFEPPSLSILPGLFSATVVLLHVCCVYLRLGPIWPGTRTPSDVIVFSIQCDLCRRHRR